MNISKIYCVIDLKSFYASVECVDRGLDPYTTPLVVCDPTQKGAITLAEKVVQICNVENDFKPDYITIKGKTIQVF